MCCKNCLVTNKSPVKFAGNTKGDILFLFDGPAPYEKRLEMPTILAKICNFLKFPLDRVFMASAHRCYFEKDKFTAGQINTIIENCKDSLDIVLKEVNPKMIICFGAISFQAAYKKSSLKNARNQFFGKDGRHIACTYNPFSILRDPSKLPAIQSDLANIKRFIDQGYKIQTDITYKEVTTIRPILDGDCLKEGDFYLTGIDTEATGVHWYDPNYITISYQVSKSLTEGWTVILHEECEKDRGDFNITINRGGTKKDPIKVDVGVKKAGNYDKKIAELKELLSRQDFKKYFFNQKFEQHAFMNMGITEFVNCCIDARVLAHTIDSNKYKNCSLDDLISEYTTYHSHKGDVTDVEKEDMLGLLKNDRAKFIKYSSLDPVMTLLVTQELKKEIIQDRKSLNYFVKFTQPIENEFLFEMERNGIKVDLTKIPGIKAKLKEEMDEILFKFKDKCPPQVYERHKDNFKLTRTIIMQESLFEWVDTKFRKNQTVAEHHNYGFNLEPVVVSQKSGMPSTDKKQVLKVILDGKYSKKVKDLVQLYIDWGERRQLITNFIKNIEYYATEDSRIHSSFSTTFTSSGRVGCISKGSMVETVRDLSKLPEGTPIENIKVGDLVFSFDDFGSPVIKKVAWAGHTGRRKVIRVHFKNIKGTDRGYLDLTPEHKVRMSNGDYINAEDLKKNMSVCSLYRDYRKTGYSRIFMTNSKINNEHRFIYESLYGKLPKNISVHHKDRNKINQTPENLEALSKKEHTIYHNSEGHCVEPKKLSSIYNREELLQMVHDVNGSITKINHDFDCFKDALRKHSIDYKKILLFYNKKGEFLSKDRIETTLCMTQREALSFLKISFYKWKKLLKYYGFTKENSPGRNQFGYFKPRKNNHLVSHIELMYEERDVYDIEVEDTHNFVVNGISVHNSRGPNLQNQPKRGHLAKLIRQLFVADDGMELIENDYKASELAWVAQVSGDKKMTRIFKEGKDPHKMVGLSMKHLPENYEFKNEKELKELRQHTKPINFGLIYLISPYSLVKYAKQEYGVVYTKKQAQEMYDKYFLEHYGIKQWHERDLAFLRKHGYLRTIFGRKQTLPNVYSENDGTAAAAERTGINSMIQGPSSDMTLLSGHRIIKDKRINKAEFKIVLFIHDALIWCCVPEKKEYYLPIVREYMEHVPDTEFDFKMNVPLTIEAEIGNNLAEMKEYKLAL